VIVIGLNGLRGSGKSTVAEHLISAHGFVRVKFAQGLKDMLHAIGLNDRHIEGDLKEVPCDLLCGKTPRHAMQTLGTEWGRALIGKELWQHIGIAKVKTHWEQGRHRVIIDDARFENECTAIRQMGGAIWRVLRHPAPMRADADLHASEVDQSHIEYDVLLRNDGAIKDLIRLVDLHVADLLADAARGGYAALEQE
jgi:hypothetical protein